MAVEETLVGVVVAAELLEELVSQIHYLTHAMVVRLKHKEKENQPHGSKVSFNRFWTALTNDESDTGYVLK